jgi:hypothetical protein
MMHTKRLRYLINVLQRTFGDKNNQVQEFFYSLNGGDERRAANTGKVQSVRDSSSHTLNLLPVLPASVPSIG